MSERGGSLLPIRRQGSPEMAFAHSQYLGRPVYLYLMFQYTVEHLEPRLLPLSQCQSSHRLTAMMSRAAWARA